MSISDNLKELSSRIPSTVSIVAVSKRKPVEDIKQAYNAGQRIFGENRVQELIEKQPLLPEDIEWHMVGHLQTKKVKQLAGFVKYIHSVDSLKLLQTIDREAEKKNRVISCLLQIHIATEENKYGFSEAEILELAENKELKSLTNVRISGLMGMATFTSDMEKVRSEFRHLKEVFLKLKNAHFSGNAEFTQLSMGMSGDYNEAIEEGSTMIRLGTIIFGPRNY